MATEDDEARKGGGSMSHSTVETMMLRDAITIPERVTADDFVLRLDQGVRERAASTLADYVVTDSIAEGFDDALGLTTSALERNQSKGAFVHGSFGAGKSHFMAVLDLLLTGDGRARTLPGLESVAKKHSGLLDRRLLAVDYHLLGAKSLEEALLSRYRATVERLHPDAPVPVLHKSDVLLDDARAWRERLGDEGFFTELNGGDGTAADGGTSSYDEWGELAGDWDGARFEAACAMTPDAHERQELVRVLQATFFKSATTTNEYLDITDGLRAMTEHAKSLGYEGVVLFLDELVLWLGQHLMDTAFIQSETSKVTKLVETPTLAVPVISFIARQRELKGFLSGKAVAAERERLGESFRHWEDRFDRITLDAADLPQIVSKRVLSPRNDAGAAALADGLKLIRQNPTAWRYLMEDEAGATASDFGLVYPFSPALVDTMVALSSLLQRERTALKIMTEILQDGRDELHVTDVIQVGELFDAVVLGDVQPLTADMEQLFDQAKSFYERKVRPWLLDHHQVTDVAALSRNDDFRRDDRLLKTLIISALVPGATPFRNLTASRLAALNPGSVKAWIPGQEAGTVVTKARKWNAAFGEITVGTGADPVITCTLTGVDYDAILDRVAGADEIPFRRRRLKELLMSELGIATGTIDLTVEHVWNGSRREVDVVFGNVRDRSALSVDAFTAAARRWRVVIDYPFDTEGEGPSFDVARVDELQKTLDTQTLVWIPHFLRAERVDDVGVLLRLEHLLSGNNFALNADAIPVTEHDTARRGLENRKQGLLESLKLGLRQAYGVATVTSEFIGEEAPPGTTFMSLSRTLRPQMPAATALRGALEDVLAQGLKAEYPDHPTMPGEGEVRRIDYASALALVRQAAAAGGRADSLEKARVQQVRRIVTGFGVGEIAENVYSVSSASLRWWELLERAAGTDEGVTVAALRDALRQYGLVSDAEDLVIMAWSAVADRVFTQYGNDLVMVPGIGELKGSFTLTRPRLPEPDVWDTARARAATLFGAGKELYRTTAAVRRVASQVRGWIESFGAPVRALPGLLEDHAHTVGLEIHDPAARLGLARAGRDLTEVLSAQRGDADLLTELAVFAIDDVDRLQAVLSGAAEAVGALESTGWSTLDGIDSVPEASSIRAEIATAVNGTSALRQVLLLATERVASSLIEQRKDDPDEVRRREEEAERRRRADKAAEAARVTAEREREEAARARAAQRAAEAEARRANEEIDRLRKQAQAKPAARKTKGASVRKVADLEPVMRELADDLTAANGRELHIEWRWE